MEKLLSKRKKYKAPFLYKGIESSESDGEDDTNVGPTAFIYKVKLNVCISSNTFTEIDSILAPLAATVIGHIVHKDKNWSIAGSILTSHLAGALLEAGGRYLLLKPPDRLESKPGIKFEKIGVEVKGYYKRRRGLGNVSLLNDEISGNIVLEPKASRLVLAPPGYYSLSLKYDASFRLEPATEIEDYYKQNGYDIRQNISRTVDLDFQKLSHLIDYKDDYMSKSCAKVWEDSLTHYLALRENANVLV